MEFYTKCLRNKIKPIIGIKINVGGGDIYLYIENFEGYQNIINIHNLIINNKLTIITIGTIFFISLPHSTIYFLFLTLS